MDLYEETKKMFARGEVLDAKNYQLYKNYSPAELEAERTRINENMHLIDDFEDSQSKLIVLNKLIGHQ